MSTHQYDPALAEAQALAREINATRAAGKLPQLPAITEALEREQLMRLRVYPSRIKKGYQSVPKAAAEFLAIERAAEFIAAAFKHLEGRDKMGDDEAAEILQRFGRIQAPQTPQPELF